MAPPALPIASLAPSTVAASDMVRRIVEQDFDYGHLVPLLGAFFRVSHGENPGIAFSLQRDSPSATWLPILALRATLAFLWPSLRSRRGGAIVGGLVPRRRVGKSY